MTGDFEAHVITTADLRLMMQRVVLHAAEILEQEAEALKASHTVNGEWRDGQDEIDAAAHAEHDDWLVTARQLRAMFTLLPRAVEEADRG